MAGIECIFQSIANSNTKSRNIFLDVLSKNHAIPEDKNVATQTITSMLSKSTSRAMGLRFLIAYLDQDLCSINTLEKKAHLWLTSIMKSCNSSEVRSYGYLIYEALALLIMRIQSTFDASKTFASTHLQKFFESLTIKEIRANVSCTNAALHALKNCLLYYPGPSKAGRIMAIKYLVSLVDSSDIDVVHRSGDCWLLLQQVRGGFRNDSDNKGQWRDFQLGILGNLHELLNVTTCSQDEIYKRPVVNIKLEYFELSLDGDPIERSARVCRRFCNLVDFLKIALSEPFPVKKCIYPKKILSLLQRGLGLNLTNFKSNPSIDKLCFETILPELHIKLLELLEVLINTCHTHIRMHYRLVLTILLDSLKSTKSATNKGPQTNFVYLRFVVYRVIKLWCTMLKDGSRCEIISDYLIKEILDDVQLQPLNNLPRSKNDIQSSMEEYTGKRNYTLICVEAFSCLQTLLLSSGHLIKHSIIKDVCNQLLIISIEMHKSRNISGQSRNWRYRMEIYKTLLIIIRLRNYRCPPPTEIMLYLIDETRSRDNSSEVRLCCQTLIDAIENMLHPQKESIFFKMDVRNRSSASEEEAIHSLDEIDNSLVESVHHSSNSDNNYAVAPEFAQKLRPELKTSDLMEVDKESNQSSTEKKHLCSPPNDVKPINGKSSIVNENNITPLPPSNIVCINKPSENKIHINNVSPVKVLESGDLKESTESKAIATSTEIKKSSPICTNNNRTSTIKEWPLQIDSGSQMDEDIDDAFVDELSAAFVDELI